MNTRSATRDCAVDHVAEDGEGSFAVCTLSLDDQCPSESQVVDFGFVWRGLHNIGSHGIDPMSDGSQPVLNQPAFELEALEATHPFRELRLGQEGTRPIEIVNC